MSGHGWVFPNADGSRARCGGPAICGACALEAQQKLAQQPLKSKKRKFTIMERIRGSTKEHMISAEDLALLAAEAHDSLIEARHLTDEFHDIIEVRVITRKKGEE